MHTINNVELMDSLSRSMGSYPKTSVVEPTMFILQDTLPNYVDKRNCLVHYKLTTCIRNLGLRL